MLRRGAPEFPAVWPPDGGNHGPRKSLQNPRLRLRLNRQPSRLGRALRQRPRRQSPSRQQNRRRRLRLICSQVRGCRTFHPSARQIGSEEAAASKPTAKPPAKSASKTAVKAASKARPRSRPRTRRHRSRERCWRPRKPRSRRSSRWPARSSVRTRRRVSGRRNPEATVGAQIGMRCLPRHAENIGLIRRRLREQLAKFQTEILQTFELQTQLPRAPHCRKLFKCHVVRCKKKIPRSQAEKPSLPLIAARTRRAALDACIVAPTWQWQTIWFRIQSME